MFKFDKDDGLHEKGRKATLLIKGMIRDGMFPMPAIPLEQLDRALQIDGEDIVAWISGRRIRIQVKCDYAGGEESLGGTGNLFLQTAELNPLKVR